MTALKTTVYGLFIVCMYITLSETSRQKRCIVIQRQSGAQAGSMEEDEDWRHERLPKNTKNYAREIEIIKPEYLKYLGPAMKNELNRIKNKINALRNHII